MSSPLGADSLLLPLRGGDCFPSWNLSRLGVRLDRGVLGTQYHVPHADFQLSLEKGEGMEPGEAPAQEVGQRGGMIHRRSRGG